MANPRKFSEKIALHNQKQAEETAAFEAIMREVTATTRQAQTKAPQPLQQHIHLAQPQLGLYRGGSLPNVNQTAIDLQGALHSLEDMKQASGRQSLIDRYRQRQMQTHRRPFSFDKRADCSPYSAAYLSPPPDLSWRRTNSDSALHTSAMGHQLVGIMQGENFLQTDNLNIYNPQHCQTRPKSCEVPGINIYPSPEQGQSIPISNNTGSLPDLTTIQFPSPLTTPLDTEDQSSCYKSQGKPTALSPNQSHHHTHITGVLSSQQQSQNSPVSMKGPTQGGPSPLVLQGSPTQVRHNNVTNSSSQGTTLEANVGRLSIETRVHQYHPYSGVVHHHSPHRSQGRQSPNRQPSPSQHSRLQVPCTLPVQLQNNVSSNQFVASEISGNNNICDLLVHPNKLQELNNHQKSDINDQSIGSSSLAKSHQYICQNGCLITRTPHQNISSQFRPCSTHPKIVISSIDSGDSILNPESNGNSSSSPQLSNSLCSKVAQKLQGSSLSYRNSQSDCPPSPNSPVSPHSFSPSQSPGLPPTSGSGSSFSENSYYNQQHMQTQATNALQHQFEQFNMIQENPATSNYNSVAGMENYSQASPVTTMCFSNSDNTDFNVMRAIAVAQQNHTVYYNSTSHGNSDIGNGRSVNSQSPHHSPHPPGSPQLPPSPQSPLCHPQQQQVVTSPTQLTSQDNYHNLSPQLSPQNQAKKIPDIIFTGADDMLARQDFAKELSNAMANMNDFDTELFPSDEALKAGLDPLDLDGLQMLTDPNIVTDPATEDSFRLDRL